MVDPKLDLTTPSTTQLPAAADAVAPDGSLVRLLLRVTGASMAHFELGPGEISIPQQHRTVDEIWYVIAGVGVMWRRSTTGNDSVVDLRHGVALTIPVGTGFQFRNSGPVALQVIGVTQPAWPGDGEAREVEGLWQPFLHRHRSVPR